MRRYFCFSPHQLTFERQVKKIESKWISATVKLLRTSLATWQKMTENIKWLSAFYQKQATRALLSSFPGFYHEQLSRVLRTFWGPEHSRLLNHVPTIIGGNGLSGARVGEREREENIAIGEWFLWLCSNTYSSSKVCHRDAVGVQLCNSEFWNEADAALQFREFVVPRGDKNVAGLHSAMKQSKQHSHILSNSSLHQGLEVSLNLHQVFLHLVM